MIHGVPIGLTVASISPRSVHVSFSKRIEKVIAVEPAIVGLPPHGYIVRDIKVSPATVKVSGAESTLAPLTTLKTEEVALQTNPNGFTEQPKLVLRGGIDVEGSQEVSVQVTYSRALVTQVLTNRAIQIKGDGDPPKWTLTPTEVEVTVTGELLAIEKATITPVVKIAPTDTKAHEVEVTIEGLPATVGRKVSPERVTVTPVRPPAPPAPTPAPPPPPP
jgi:YbbR domain-containing protein